MTAPTDADLDRLLALRLAAPDDALLRFKFAHEHADFVSAAVNSLEPLCAEVKRLRSFEQFFHDASDDFVCLPKCDSIAHEPDCPATNAMAAFRKLRQDNERLRASDLRYYHGVMLIFAVAGDIPTIAEMARSLLAGHEAGAPR